MNRLKSFGFWGAVLTVVVVGIAGIRLVTSLAKKAVTIPPAVDNLIP